MDCGNVVIMSLKAWFFSFQKMTGTVLPIKVIWIGRIVIPFSASQTYRAPVSQPDCPSPYTQTQTCNLKDYSKYNDSDYPPCRESTTI